ncbi:MAG: hypothetical protein RL217_927 [Pseudomonadota bacterium]|jgi:hypothetical protein
MTPIAKLIQSNGQPLFGQFPQGVQELNYRDYDLRTAMDEKRSDWAKKWRFNQFQFISFSAPDFIVGLAIVDLKLVSNAFLYWYDTQSGQFDEYSFLQPLARHTAIAPFPNQGASHFQKGKNRIEIQASTTTGVRLVRVDLADKLQIRASIDENSHYHPLSVCTRAGYSGWVFTQKSAARSCEGQIRIGNNNYDLKQSGALAAVDWTGGFMRRETFWNWGSLSCTLNDGRRLGFNLAAGVNETGFSENCLWLDDRPIKIDMMDFRFDRYQKHLGWQLKSNDGIVDLHFTPKGQRQDKTNAFIIASNFTQYFGQYRGEIRLADETLILDGQWGLTEDHYAKW